MSAHLSFFRSVYAILREHPELGSIVFDHDASMSRQSTGQGCGSLTMTMPDDRLSLFAAGMSEYLLARQREGLPEAGGEVLIGRLSDDGIGLTWRALQVPPAIVVPATNGGLGAFMFMRERWPGCTSRSARIISATITRPRR